MLRTLLGRTHSSGPEPAPAPGHEPLPKGSTGLLYSLHTPVELRELSGALDRHVAAGPLRLYGLDPGSGGRGPAGEAAGVLRVGEVELPFGRRPSELHEPGAPPPPPICHRIDAWTLRLEPAPSRTSSPGPGAGPSSALLLIFPRAAPGGAQAVARAEAVVRDLALGRGAPEPAGERREAPGDHSPHSAAASDGHLLSPEARVLFHDADPARSTGWRDSHPVRLLHLERLPPASPPAPRGPPASTLRGALSESDSGRSDGSGGGPRLRRNSGGGGGGSGKGGSRAMGPSAGDNVGSPGGTISGRLRGLGLGSVYGSVAVANLAYEKDVRVRYTLDGWATWDEVRSATSANWDKRLGFGADNFNFLIDLDGAAGARGVAVRRTLGAGSHVTLGLAVHYVVAGGSHWDNNDGQNYTFDLPAE
ncbi:hypothetical protein HYH03_000633 [Edaphochlamys debaryana]|uniref:CBM21 domain-containing protein n=1 Tax=Edaphochlamys debaryana TaxID=47281 RepID=A0A835YJK7_9CHLO|nr:hypothetical protein HYH03_000633 [Edaphochlamys debaryana]|eukprot:KAG2502146.1 hypothetical protein HYH03_000633 [Edaphochlamys debaryana]